ncbi:MAG: hypothetical protein ACRDJN_29035, partial [Chloroflexota bacterium]
VAALNSRFPSRAAVCGGRPPLVAHPTAIHSGRPYDPAREADLFDPAAVDRVLSQWRWHRLVGKRTGQFSFADRSVSVGKAWGGQAVTLRFDPTDRQVVVAAPGTRPGEEGAEIKRFHCPAFEPDAIRGAGCRASSPRSSPLRPGDRPPPPGDTGALHPYGT